MAPTLLRYSPSLSLLLVVGCALSGRYDFDEYGNSDDGSAGATAKEDIDNHTEGSGGSTLPVGPPSSGGERPMQTGDDSDDPGQPIDDVDDIDDDDNDDDAASQEPDTENEDDQQPSGPMTPTPICTPGSCELLEANCGRVLDGCGGILDCGTCAGSDICGGDGPNRCGAAPCSPTTCAELPFIECGTISDGCEGTLDCGSCAAPETCGGLGVAGVCGCSPLSCTEMGLKCGNVTDSCGKPLDCGGCPEPFECNAGQCECPAQSCEELEAECGTIQDRCGNELDCGTCDDGEVCGVKDPHRCSEPPCVPATCGSDQCGTFADGCGGTLDCGECSSCEDDDADCECEPTTCKEEDAECGTIDDGCGGTLDCGECDPPLKCDLIIANICLFPSDKR